MQRAACVPQARFAEQARAHELLVARRPRARARAFAVAFGGGPTSKAATHDCTACGGRPRGGGQFVQGVTCTAEAKRSEARRVHAPTATFLPAQKR